MAGTTVASEIHIRCTGCTDAFRVTEEGVIKVHDAEYGEMDWPVGGTLAEYIEYPDCSGCGSELTFSTERITR